MILLLRLPFFIILLFVLAALPANTQKRSAQKLYDEATRSINKSEAEELYLQAIDKDKAYSDAYVALARLYEQQQAYDNQVKTLQDATLNCEKNLPFLWAQLAKASYLNGNYDLAQTTISKLGDYNDPQLLHLQNCINFSIDATGSPLEFHPRNLGEEINTKHHDYWPSLSIDEQQIVTTVFVDKEDEEVLNTAQEDLFISKKTGDSWAKAKPLSPIINSIENEGAQSLSADGNTMLFTACNRFDGFGSCDIFITYKVNGVWSPPVPLAEPINSEYWDGHPCLSSDSKQLYFASNRKGGYGGVDLYVADIEMGKTFSVTSVSNLGDAINSSKDEVSPYIHPDKHTLYFSSDGLIGLGRQDVYIAKKSANGVFEEAVNLGYPINTHKDEIGFIVSPSGQRAYFSSERYDSCKKDIYAFDLPTDLRPNEVTYLKAKVKDKITKKDLKASVTLSLISTGEIIYEASKVDLFTIPLEIGKDYAISVSHEGYLFHSEHIALSKDLATPFEKEVLLASLHSGEKIILENILFNHDSYELDTSFTSELEQAIALINENPKLQFEISGHTDNLGSAEYNLRLSEQRAKVVYLYFIKKGADPMQLSYKGYGHTQPISDNNSINRRTELLIK